MRTLAIAAIAVALPLSASSQVMLAPGWRVAGESIVNNASGLTCPAHFAGLQLRGVVPVPSEQPACGYLVDCSGIPRCEGGDMTLVMIVPDLDEGLEELKGRFEQAGTTPMSGPSLGHSHYSVNMKGDGRAAFWASKRNGRNIGFVAFYTSSVAASIENFVQTFPAGPAAPGPRD